MNRRQILAGGAATAAYGFASCACAQQQSGVGCFVDDAWLARRIVDDKGLWNFNIDKDPVFGGSGDRQFDQALARTLSSLCDTFDVLPGFAFFNEDEGPNAFASTSTRLKRADGSVVFGQQLLAKLMSAPENPAAGVAAVCAHEFGHIMQYKLGLHRRLVGADHRVKRLELQADYFAGYFSGVRKTGNPAFPAAVVANTQYGVGDTMVSNPQHHGTPEERGRAVVAGYQACYRDKKTISEAIAISTDYVMGLPG